MAADLLGAEVRGCGSFQAETAYKTEPQSILPHSRGGEG